MRIFVSDLSSITTKTGPRIRFSVTYYRDDKPYCTEKGWSIDGLREICPPRAATRFGKYYNLIEPSSELLDDLASFWLRYENAAILDAELGPQVNLPVDKSGNKKIEGGGEV